MTDSNALGEINADLKQRLGKKLSLRRGDLDARMKRAGRRLPKSVHKDGAVIARANALAVHPKLRRRIDMQEVSRAHAHIGEHLDSIDPWDRRKGVVLGIMAGLGVNFVLLAVAVLALLSWRGLI